MIVLNLVLTSMLTCLIWIIQIVHYPSFRFINVDTFTNFEAFHTKSISFIVLPLMLGELAVCLYLLLNFPLSPLTITQAALVALIWLSTFCLSVPCHNLLKERFDSKTIEKLIYTNWPRTILWSVKLIISTYLYIEVIYE